MIPQYTLFSNFFTQRFELITSFLCISDCDCHDNVKFHVKGDLQNYTKKQIQDIVHVVADILHCKEEDIGIQGLQKSQSFILILSIKKDLTWKLSVINEADLLKFDRLNIDYLIVRERLILLKSSRGKCF